MIDLTVTHEPRVAARAKKVLYIIDGKIADCKEFCEGVDRDKELEDWLFTVGRSPGLCYNRKKTGAGDETDSKPDAVPGQKEKEEIL